MHFVLTTAAKQWIEDNPGGVPAINSFKVGAGFGYTPVDTAIDLQGAEVYSGVPSGYGVQDTGAWLFGGVMDTSVGSFYWGEVGLYRNGVLFAIGTQSTLAWKVASTEETEGNNVTLQIYLHPASNGGVAQVGNSSNELNAHYVTGVAQLPPAHLAFPNVVIIPSPLNTQVSVLATAVAGAWSVAGWDATRFQGSIDSATASSLVLPSPLAPPSMMGEYLVMILSGEAAGYVRAVSGYVVDTNRVLLNVPLPITPQAGDVVRIMQSKAAASAETLPVILWQLDPELVAEDINQLKDLDALFAPLLRRDGSNAMTSALDLGGNKVFNVADPTLAQDAATKAYVDAQVTGFATTQDVSNAVAGLASEAYVTSAIVNLVDQAYVSAEIGAAIAGLASETFVTDAVTGLASEAFVTSAVATAVTGLATEVFATNAAASAVAGLASVAYVDAQVLGLASEEYVDAEITSALTGYATQAYVDAAIEGIVPSTPPDLTPYLLLDGTRPMSGDLNLGTHKIIGLADPTTAQEAATKKYVDDSIASSGSGVTETEMNTAIATALTGYATEAFVATAISNIPTPTAIETAGGWTISEVGGNLVFRLNGVAKATLDVNANLKVEGAGEFLSLKYLSYMQEPAVALGTLTSATIEVDPSDGTTVSFTVDVAATQVNTTLLDGQFVTLIVSLLQESAVTWTDVVWADGLDPTFSIGARNIVHLWRVGATIFGTKIGEF